MSKFGRYQVAEAPSALMRLHFHTGAALREVDHEPKIAVLDQEDLLAQGIRCSQFIPGATDIDALGSCCYNANTSALSNVVPQAAFLKATGAGSYQDTVALEKFAIVSYHQGTDQSGDPSQEWPPADCGSTGPYIVQYDQRRGWVKTEQIAHGAQNVASLLQTDGLLTGQPFLNAWMQPDVHGFIDGDGKPDTVLAQIQQGVAGGHETYMSAIEKLALDRLDRVDPWNTIVRLRNSWTKSWGDHGSYRAHLSTFTEILGQQVDFRQLAA